MREIRRVAAIPRSTLRDRALREAWPCRERPCRGGWRRLYPLETLPADIRAALLEPAPKPGPQPPLNAPSSAVEALDPIDAMSRSVPPEEGARQRRFERLPDAGRARALAKLALVDEIVALAASAGISMRAACERAAGAEGCRWSAGTLLVAWRTVRDLPRQGRAAALADRRRSAGGPRAACDPVAWQAWKADYLRAERPAAAACLRRLLRLAAERGWAPVPRYAKYYLRRQAAELPPGALALARRGPEAAGARRPALIRDREALDSLEILCCDGHTWDVRVAWPDGTVSRPVGTFWQDVRSGRLLGWRIGRSESAEAYRLSLADVLWEHGAPEHVIADNGRGICAQALTGGALNKFRGADADIKGLLTELVGSRNVHFTIPYCGRSKPIERAFRDLCEDVARDPRLAGACTGKDPASKPHNYGAKAIPLERFRQVAADGVAQHNARSGRRGQGMDGRSFDEVFAACLPAAGPRTLSPEALSRWLLAAATVTARASDGSVEVRGARYWSQALADRFAGRPKSARRAVVRTDSQRLDRPARVELPDGSLVGLAEPLGKVAYLDKAAAEAAAKARARARRADREALAAHEALGAAALGSMLDAAAADPPVASPALADLLPDPGAAAGEAAEIDELIRQGDEFILELSGLAGGEPS